MSTQHSAAQSQCEPNANNLPHPKNTLHSKQEERVKDPAKATKPPKQRCKQFWVQQLPNMRTWQLLPNCTTCQGANNNATQTIEAWSCFYTGEQLVCSCMADMANCIHNQEARCKRPQTTELINNTRHLFCLPRLDAGASLRLPKSWCESKQTTARVLCVAVILTRKVQRGTATQQRQRPPTDEVRHTYHICNHEHMCKHDTRSGKGLSVA